MTLTNSMNAARKSAEPCSRCLTSAFDRERVRRIELPYSAWEFDEPQSADLGRWTNGQVGTVFPVPARPPRSAEISSVLARMWHGLEGRRPQIARLRACRLYQPPRLLHTSYV